MVGCYGGWYGWVVRVGGTVGGWWSRWYGGWYGGWYGCHTGSRRGLGGRYAKKGSGEDWATDVRFAARTCVATQKCRPPPTIGAPYENTPPLRTPVEHP